MKGKLTEQEKIYVNYVSGKELTFGIYKELRKPYDKTNNPVKKWSNGNEPEFFVKG